MVDWVGGPPRFHRQRVRQYLPGENQVVNTVYLVLIIPQISDRLDNRVFRFVTGEVPTREGILNYLRAPKDLRTLYLGSQPATDIMTTEALHDEFDHLAEPLIPSIEKDDFPHPIQGIQSVGTYIYVGLAQQGWIGIQTVPILSLLRRSHDR